MTRLSTSILSRICFLVLGVPLHAQDASELELTMSGGVLEFRLASLEWRESWMLQQSSDGETWTDVIPFQSDLGSLGYTATVLNDPQADQPSRMIFRARKYSRHLELSQEYEAALARWNEAALTSYSYVVTSSTGFFRTETRYTVVDGEVTEVEVLSAFPEFIMPPDDVTVDDWFATIASAIENDAFRIDVDWDPSLGFPETTYIDFDEWLADEERGWAISEVTPLE